MTDLRWTDAERALLDRLFAEGVLTPSQIRSLEKARRQSGQPLLAILVRLRLLSGVELRRFLSMKSLSSADEELLQTASAAPAAPKTIGRYEVIEELGRGGMGVVYRARHPELGQEVAIKVLFATSGVAPISVERFRREARTGALVAHPNLVRVLDAGTLGDAHFLVMEMVAGQSLADLVAQGGPVALTEARRILRQCLEALRALHNRGFVHRDVKPQNILIARDGLVRLVDYGLARQVGDPRLTRGFHWVGTPLYASLEQLEGKEIDGRSDLYSLGLSILYALTGVVPRQASSEAELLSRLRKGEMPSASECVPDLPAGDRKLLGRLVATEVDKRARGAEEVLADLELVEAGGAPAPTARVQVPVRRRRSRWLAGAAAIGALVLLALGYALGAWLGGGKAGGGGGAEDPGPPPRLALDSALLSGGAITAPRMELTGRLEGEGTVDGVWVGTEAALPLEEGYRRWKVRVSFAEMERARIEAVVIESGGRVTRQVLFEGPVDYTAPRLAILSPDAGATVGAGPVKVAVRAEDSSGVSRVQANGRPLATDAEHPLVWLGEVILGQDAIGIEFSAADRYGNETATPLVHPVRVVSDAARAAIETPVPNAEVSGEEITVTGSATGNGVSRVLVNGVPARKLGGDFTRWEAVVPVPAGEDLFTLSAVAEDAEGRPGPIHEITVRVARAALRIEVTSHAPGAVVQGPTVLLAGTASSGHRVRFVVVARKSETREAGKNATLETEGSLTRWRVEIELAPGEQEIEIVAEDAADQRRSVMFKLVRQDATGPALVVESPRDGQAVEGDSIEIAGRLDGAPGPVWIAGRDTPLDPGGRFVRRLPLAPGRNRIDLRAARPSGGWEVVELSVLVLPRPSPLIFEVRTRAAGEAESPRPAALLALRGGNLLVYAPGTPAAFILDPKTGKRKAVLPEAGSIVAAGAAREGSLLVLAGPRDVAIVDLAGGKTTKVSLPEGMEAVEHPIAVHPSGAWAVLYFRDRGAMRVDLASGQAASLLPELGEEKVWGAGLDPSGRFIALDGPAFVRVQVADLETGNVVSNFEKDPNPEDPLGCSTLFALSPDGRTVAGTNAHRTLGWGPASERTAWSEKVGVGNPLFVARRRGEAAVHFLSARGEWTRIPDEDPTKRESWPLVHGRMIRSAALLDGEEGLGILDETGTVWAWEKPGAQPASCLSAGDSVLGLVFHRDGKSLAAIHSGVGVRLVDVKTGRSSRVSGRPETATLLWGGWCGDESGALRAVTGEGTVLALSGGRLAERGRWPGLPSRVVLDGARKRAAVVFAGSEGWSLLDPLAEEPEAPASLREGLPLAFSPEGDALLFSSDDGDLGRVLLDGAVPIGRTLALPVVEGGPPAPPLRALSIPSSDAFLLFSPGATLADFARATPRAPADEALRRPTALAIDPSGTYAILGFADGRLAALSAGDLSLLGWMSSSHAGEVAAIEFSPDGRLLATCDVTGAVFLWGPP
ncbi:MAG: protein kinase [Planctomycetes bacterium]|nr:protein kinase [Planctomycetota bacterium]